MAHDSASPGTPEREAIDREYEAAIASLLLDRKSSPVKESVERDAFSLIVAAGPGRPRRPTQKAGAEPVHYGADTAHHDVHTHSEDRSAETFGRLFEGTQE